MIVDTSAVVAVIFDESDAEYFEDEISGATVCRMSVANYFEAAMVIEGRMGEEGARELDSYLETAGIEFVPVRFEHVHAARLAWRRYGKGNHPAGLNFGDCFAYALAEIVGEPLLYKGDDFALTDVESAL